MSYEGYTTFLCENGHKHTVDAMSLIYGSIPYPITCEFCGAPIIWSRDTDETNGYEDDNPNTHDTGVVEIGFDDDWHTDHYNNRYSVKVVRYAPDPKDAYWRKIQLTKE